MNYQQLIIAGNATGDTQRRVSQSGTLTYATFTVAVSGMNDQATFFPVVVFGNQVDAVVNYVTKGRQVLVAGRIQVNNNGRFSVVWLGKPSHAAARRADQHSGRLYIPAMAYRPACLAARSTLYHGRHSRFPGWLRRA